MLQQTEDRIKWIEEQVYLIADEVGIQLDGPPEWDAPDPLNFKMAVEVAGQRKILKLWRPHIDDSQGGDNQPTREGRGKLQSQLREFLGFFSPPKRRIGFWPHRARWIAGGGNASAQTEPRWRTHSIHLS